MESSKNDEELKLDDKKEKLYDIKLRNLTKEVTSQINKNIAVNPFSKK
jgi:hypothetical protein